MCITVFNIERLYPPCYNDINLFNTYEKKKQKNTHDSVGALGCLGRIFGEILIINVCLHFHVHL